jgi:CheY-like chemotaxis protein
MSLTRILLIDDDCKDHDLFTHALDCIQLDIFCKCVSTGWEAMEHLSNTIVYDMIFLDLQMPKMNGIECLRLLKQHEKCHAIPVIIFTTCDYNYHLNECLEIGAARIFQKPGSFPELCDGLRGILMN